MIVGIRFSRVPVHVGAYAETRFRIFVNHLTIRRVFIETRSKELSSLRAPEAIVNRTNCASIFPPSLDAHHESALF